MLDPYADGKSLWLELYARAVEKPERVVCRMPHRRDESRARFLAAAAQHRAYAAVIDIQSRERGLKADLTAEGYYLLTHILYNFPQNIGTDVRLCLCKHRLVRSELCEGLKHKAAAWVAYAGGQLAVGECPRAALAELHV